jgi:outer membrane lipoprotein LolB
MRVLTLTLIAFLAGCAAVSERPPSPDIAAAWQMRQASLAAINRWELHGRVALRSGDDGGQASLQWTRDVDMHRIELTGPISSARVRLTQTPFGAEMRDTEDHVYRDSSIQRLLQRRIGWELPVDELNYWILGLPARGAVSRSELDPWGRLKTLEQAGWEVRFLEYAQQGELELPSRLSARRVGSSTPIEVRVAIETFNLAGASKR